MAPAVVGAREIFGGVGDSNRDWPSSGDIPQVARAPFKGDNDHMPAGRRAMTRTSYLFPGSEMRGSQRP